MDKRTAIALSPIPECLCMAARCSWDDLHVAGRKRIVSVLDGWVRRCNISNAIVLVSQLTDPAFVRKVLRQVGRCGTEVQWFAPHQSKSVAQACARLGHVRLVQGNTLAEAFDAVFPPAADAVNCSDPDLRDYLRYEITLSFMRSLDADPLKEAIETIRKTPFRVPAKDRDSLGHFREADFPYLEGQSKTTTDLKARILEIASTDMRVLITGETGTGKEAVAFYLHEFSARRSKPFVSINCAGLEENFLRSELFGHRKGAFTGAIQERKGLVERAKGGTLFLDELADMPGPVQADLLRFLETKRYRRMGEDKESTADARIVAAAQPHLRQKLESGEFRHDLFYRIAEVELETPSLADVPEDIIRIIRHIAYRFDNVSGSRKTEEAVAYFQQGEETLRSHRWRGNVRELAGYVRRKLLLDDDVLEELGHPTDVPGVGGHEVHLSGDMRRRDIRPVNQVVSEYVRHVFDNKGKLSQKEVAFRLGISVNTLKKHVRNR